MVDVSEAIFAGIFPGGPFGKMVYDKLKKTITDAPSNADLPSVVAETARQENEMRRLEAQAKVAQEMAIASRIEAAEQVEVEEYYEYSGDGKRADWISHNATNAQQAQS